MKLSPILYAAALAGVSQVHASPVPTPTTSTSASITENLSGKIFARANGLMCGPHDYTQDQANAAYNEAGRYVLNNIKPAKSKSGKKYPFEYGNNEKFAFPAGDCTDGMLYEWPILRSGAIFGTTGNKIAGDDRAIIAIPQPSNSPPTSFSNCALITHDGATISGGFVQCT